MNKNIKKLMVAGLVCVALCGTTLAAPRGGTHGRVPQKAPAHQRTAAPRAAHHNQTHAHHAVKPAHHTTHVVHHMPPPPPRPAPVVVHHMPPPPPAPVVVHHECDAGTGLGALLGALVGGLLGAAL